MTRVKCVARRCRSLIRVQVLPVVAGDVEIGLEVVVLVAGAGDVDGLWIERRQLDAADQRPLAEGASA